VKKKDKWGSIRYKQANKLISKIESRAHYAPEPARGIHLSVCPYVHCMQILSFDTNEGSMEAEGLTFFTPKTSVKFQWDMPRRMLNEST